MKQTDSVRVTSQIDQQTLRHIDEQHKLRFGLALLNCTVDKWFLIYGSDSTTPLAGFCTSPIESTSYPFVAEGITPQELALPVESLEITNFFCFDNGSWRQCCLTLLQAAIADARGRSIGHIVLFTYRVIARIIASLNVTCTLINPYESSLEINLALTRITNAYRGNIDFEHEMRFLKRNSPRGICIAIQ